MNFFKKTTLAVLVAMAAFASVCSAAAPPPLFNDGRGHGAVMESIEYAVDHAPWLNTWVTNGRPCGHEIWRIDLKNGATVFVGDVNGATTYVSCVDDDANYSFAVLRVVLNQLLQVNFDNVGTGDAYVNAWAALDPYVVGKVNREVHFVDGGTGRVFAITKARVELATGDLNLFTIRKVSN